MVSLCVGDYLPEYIGVYVPVYPISMFRVFGLFVLSLCLYHPVLLKKLRNSKISYNSYSRINWEFDEKILTICNSRSKVSTLLTPVGRFFV